MNNQQLMQDRKVECQYCSRSFLIYGCSRFGLILFLGAFLFLSCLAAVKGETTDQAPLVDRSFEPVPKSVSYRLEQMNAATRKFIRNLQPYQLLILEKINRADRLHLTKLPAIVVPEQWEPDELAYSPLPRSYPWVDKYAKALVIDQPLQAFGAYEYGRLIRWGPVSTGRRSRPTPSGLFHLNWRSRGRHSTVNPEWYMPWYFNIDNRRGLSVHAYNLPGYPASHACVRLLEYDAKWLYDWGEEYSIAADRRTVLKLGTPVLILGRYDYNSPPPWRSPDLVSGSPETPQGKSGSIGNISN